MNGDFDKPPPVDRDLLTEEWRPLSAVPNPTPRRNHVPSAGDGLGGWLVPVIFIVAIVVLLALLLSGALDYAATV